MRSQQHLKKTLPTLIVEGMYVYVCVCIMQNVHVYACICMYVYQPKSLYVCIHMCMYCMYHYYRMYMHVCCLHCMHWPRQVLMHSQQAQNIPLLGGNPWAPNSTAAPPPYTAVRDPFLDPFWSTYALAHRGGQSSPPAALTGPPRTEVAW